MCAFTKITILRPPGRIARRFRVPALKSIPIARIVVSLLPESRYCTKCEKK